MPRIENGTLQKVYHSPRQMVLLTMWGLGWKVVSDWVGRLASVLILWSVVACWMDHLREGMS